VGTGRAGAAVGRIVVGLTRLGAAGWAGEVGFGDVAGPGAI
jgi:hypothetical protein